MKLKKSIFLSLFLAFAMSQVHAQDKKFKIHTVAFYNVENLFDTINQANYDEEYLPQNGWTSKKYKQKLNNLARVIVGIGTNDQQKESPTILGVCEVENKGVLEDLVKNPQIASKDYGIVHFDSPDKRGIDVGFLYQKKHFKPTSYINVPLYVYQNEADTSKKEEKDAEESDKPNVNFDATSKRIYTRDQLLVTGLLDGEEMHFIVNHWPSRSGGEKRSSPYREAAGRLNRKIMDSLFKINPNAKIITMGDLNDGTYNKSVKEGIGAKLKKSEVKKSGIYNPFEQMAKDGNATLFYRDSGDIFDQIMLSEPFLRNDFSSFQYWKAGIYNKQFLIQISGQYKGYPLRNSPSEPGFSDHFPVYIYLLKEIK
ncbi:endonuclease [Flavobacterium tegetincola]|uniref:endonuclease/exonuclease/phosphatase family protein n=1 Tax=Flavobacterium tegetincola TaxID=150172 RepID=UPI000407226E|nr:endonuclease [Flavobacterium tegetincola]